MDRRKLKHYAARVKLESGGLDRKIIAKVAGVTFEGRQDIIAQIKKDTPVRLVRDRRNEYDFYAVEVHVDLGDGWQQAGFIPNPMCRMIAQTLDKGLHLSAAIHRVTGGMVSEFTGENLNYGLEVTVFPEE